ncbi:hypothetical protein KJ671_00860 [Patescibacteria group bacterium]|nr:hypothetical protein [Patescibacteria group bacterium]
MALKGDKMVKKKIANTIGEQWDLLNTMLSGMYNEIDKLCKKKPDMLLSEMKTKKINKLIMPIKELLGDENSFICDIEELDTDDPIELSDVIIVLNELQKGLKIYRDNHYYDDDDGYGWYLEKKYK